LRRIKEVDAEVRYGSINWNYMPRSGAGLIHPHFQLVASNLPTQFQRQMEVASKDYKEGEGENSWSDLISEEKGKGERYVGNIGPVHWFVSYAPRGIIDVQSVFEEADSLLRVSKETLRDFASRVSFVLRYVDSKNMWTFNLSVYGILVSQDYFWANCRVVPRMGFPPLEISEINFFERLHGEMLTTMPPEEICGELRDFLGRP
jgi:galactose-1-phosphate uridylyltransferase